MKRSKFHPFDCRRRAAALVIVLCFTVLLSALAMAFFTQATAYRSMSAGSVNEFKADHLAESALAIIVADLKQEIVDGSTATTAGNDTLYAPTVPQNAVPMRSGNPSYDPATAPDPIPNLIRRSVRSDSIVSPGRSSRASAASSTVPALNGRFVSSARWNQHYLIPRDPSKFGGADAAKIGTDPVTAFEAPDWVYVTDQGPEVLTSSTKSVIGRYAFAIYDEGGLLDMNVAGYPTGVPVQEAHPTPNPRNLKFWGTGAKNSLAFADLKVLGLTQTEIDQIAGWRSYASSQPGGNFPGLTFDPASALRYHDHSIFHPTSFLEVPPVSWTSRTDQLFASRQQLLKFRSKLGFSQDALQYMGTFSRDVEQPSYTPNPGRPRIRAAFNANNGTWGSGNDAFNLDRGAQPVADINPPFLQVRVKSSFVRDDGSTAEVGDPLLKERFPLSRLGLILKSSTASKSSSDPIYRNFGLFRSSVSDPWQYDHGDSRGILRLDEVADEGREPDFIELLKAAIDIGSLGKGANAGASLAHLTTQHRQDTLTTLHLLQIAANIIDQYDSDGYPTRIQIQDASGGFREVSGMEDLPYIYHMRDRLAYASPTVGRLLLQPVVWNPNDPASGAPSGAPTEFRIRPQTIDPAQQMNVRVTYNRTGVPDLNLSPDWDEAAPMYGPVTFSAGESNGFHGFRQPVLLGEADLPLGSNAEGNDTTQPFSALGNIIGLVVTDFPLKLPAEPPATGTGYAWTLRPSGPGTGVEFILEYRDGGNWIKYDSFIGREEGSSHAINIGYSTLNTDAKLQAHALSLMSDGTGWHGESVKTIDRVPSSGDPTRWWGMTRGDPRTGRWGTYTWQYANLPRVLDKANNIYATHREGVGLSFANHHTRPSDNGMKSVAANYSSKNWHRGFQFGYWAENSTRETRQEEGNTLRYIRDPDGIVRRAIGGYSTDPKSGGSFDKLDGLPLATENYASRPLILNRPFQNVAELGMVSRADMWKNVSFSFPESGDSALLDLFCIEEPAHEGGIVAGRVNLNTRQDPVVKAILAGTVKDPANPTELYSETEAEELGQALVARTSDTTTGARKGPLSNRAHLVGRWDPDTTKNPAGDLDPEFYYSGFSGDIGTVASLSGQPGALIPRQREAAIRALADIGTVRTWNLLVDVIGQSGKFPRDGTSLDKFVVEGEKRYWLHLAIDRVTGEVIDRQLEMVTE